MNSAFQRGIIIQARTGSTRLPLKMLLPFYKEMSLIEVLLQRLVNGRFNVPIILATSNKEQDDKLASLAKSYGINIFRGDEIDVLNRFVGAAESFGVDYLIRICADNPFLSLAGIRELLRSNIKNQYDYVTYRIDKTPVIKTHFGFWAEGVSTQALRQIGRDSTSVSDHEHVTKYIYENPDRFSINWLTLPDNLDLSDKIRLTVDTPIDFAIAKEIFEHTYRKEKDLTVSQVVKFLKSNPDYLGRMKGQMINNEK